MKLGKEMKQYRSLYVKAAKGDVAALGKLAAANDFLKKQVNWNLRELRTKGFDYGAAYNNAMYFTQTEYDTTHFLSSAQLKYDPIDILTNIEQMIKFSSYKGSTVAGQQSILENKRKVFVERGIVPETIKDRTFKSFVKFLANEETREIVEDYSDSDKIIEMLYNAFKSRKNTVGAMKRAFSEYLGRRYTRQQMGFDELMERMGIDVYSEKYRR